MHVSSVALAYCKTLCAHRLGYMLWLISSILKGYYAHYPTSLLLVHLCDLVCIYVRVPDAVGAYNEIESRENNLIEL